MKEILDRANQENYAVAAPVVQTEFNARTAIKCAEELNAPIILLVPLIFDYDVDLFGRYLKELAQSATVPVAINHDHGSDFPSAVECIRAGFSSIMVDRSELPFEENIREVQEMVRICHALGISVEAELGHVGVGEQYHTDGHQAFTRVEEAVEYVKQTGVDALAVAIGTAHGVYKGTPQIHFDLLHELKDALDIPLVLHGGSGTGDENLARCAREGINKINLSNDLKRSAIENLVKEDLSGNCRLSAVSIACGGIQT